MPQFPFPDFLTVVFTLALSAILITVSLTDVREMRIPNVCNGVLWGSGMLACIFVNQQTVVWALSSQ